MRTDEEVEKKLDEFDKCEYLNERGKGWEEALEWFLNTRGD